MPDSNNLIYRKDRYQTKWANSKKGKETYIDKILFDAKQPGRYVPGPSDYKTEYVVHPTTKRYKWDKEKRNTIIDQITKDEKKKVAPNAYKTDPAFVEKIKGVYLQ